MFFENINKAIKAVSTENMSFSKYIDAKNKISQLEAQLDMPCTKLEKQLGKTLCQIEYGTDDWLGSIQSDTPDSIYHNCPNFCTNQKCTNTNCAKHADNHAYFDAKSAYETAKQNRINAVKRIFGIRAK